MAPRALPGYLRYRVIKRHDAGDAEITNDLPHLHQSQWNVVAFQPGAPSSAIQGSFSIPLFPPGSRQFRTAKPIYDQLAKYLRVEGYLGYSPNGIGLGKLAFAGLVTGVHRSRGGDQPSHTLTGTTDLGVANLTRPFSGEFMSNDVTSAMLKSFLGQNELGWTDKFNPYTSANYNPGNLVGGSQGTWSGTTDDGLNVVSNSTGVDSVLIAKTGASANDRWHTMYVEAQGRLQPSTDTVNAGRIGIGLSQSSANVVTNSAFVGLVTATYSNGRYNLNASVDALNGGSVVQTLTRSAVLLNVDDATGFIPLTIGLLLTDGGGSGTTPNMTLTVNGQVVIGQFATGVASLGTTTFFPFLYSNKAATGSSTSFLTNLSHFTRFTTDGPSTAATFGNGSITATTNHLQWGTDPGPTFLDAWTRLATREGFYLRYNPRPYVVGTRTLGTVDFAADPGTDRSNSVIFDAAAGNLVALTIDENADTFTAGTQMSGQSTIDGGGLAYWKDISAMTSIGVLEDQTLGVTNSDFNTLRQQARQIMGNKVAVGINGHKSAVVLRDVATADKYRELDKVTINDPEMGANHQSMRIMARQFTEGSGTETLTLDQFSWHGQELGL